MTKHLAKRVSNYELFFDLAVVLAIGQLTTAIHIDTINVSNVLFFLGGSIILLNIWNFEAIYYNKYGDSRRADIYTVILLMMWLGNLALAYNFDINVLTKDPGNTVIFNSMLVLAYATIAAQYFFKGKKLGFSQDIKSNIILQIIYLVPLVPVALGLLPYSHWVLAYSVLPIFVPILLRLPFIRDWHARHFDTNLNFPHFVERNQLLMILTFGETVIGTIRTYPLRNFPLEGFFLFLGMAGLFLFYMTQTFVNINHHQKTSVMPYFYSHALAIISLLFFTVGLEFMSDHHHYKLGVIFFIFSVVGFYIGVLSTSRYNQELYKPTLGLMGQYAAALLLAILAFVLLRDNLLAMGISLVVLDYIMLQIGMNFRKKQREKHNVPHPDPTLNIRDFS